MNDLEDYMDLGLESVVSQSEPRKPPANDRLTYFVTTDYAKGSAKELVQAFHDAGIFASIGNRFPRTTIIVMTEKSCSISTVKGIVKNNLLPHGCAVISEVNGYTWVWPDKKWRPDDEKKTWRVWKA